MINVYINEPGLEDYILHTYRADEFHVSIDTGYLSVLNDDESVAVYPPGSWHHVHQPDNEAPSTTEDTVEINPEGDDMIPKEDLERIASKVHGIHIVTSKREH